MTTLLKYRYHLLGAVVFALMLSRTLNGVWSSDFWEHSAVVRELATNPLHPHHPQLLLDAPHAFFSPYLMGVALATRLTGLSPIQALSVAGMLNLLLFLVGLWLFLSVLPVEDLPTTAFYALLFVLLLIGPEPPTTSGFFHLRYLGIGLPYPSTFATGLSFVAAYCYARALRDGRLRWFGVTLLLAVIIILTHSLTFIFLGCAMVALTLGAKGLRWMDFAKLGMLFALTVGLAALWPYFPFLKLMLGESRVYDASNYGIYLQRVSLAITLLGVPFLILRLKRNWRDPLVILFALLSGIYAFGYLTQHWSYGRVAAGIVLVLDTALASAAAGFEMRLSKRSSATLDRWLFAGAVLLFCAAFSYKTVLTPALREARPGYPDTYSRHEFLSVYTDQYDVILSDVDTSWPVPTFGGKIVATRHPVAFVPDQATRLADLEHFFSKNAEVASRWEIIRRYHADFLLFSKNRTPDWEAIAQPFLEAGKQVYEDDRFVLIELPSAP